MVLTQMTGPTGNGPIDNLRMDQTGLQCPVCRAFDVWYIPEQSGPCHSGDFSNTCIEHYWCESCDSSLSETP